MSILFHGQKRTLTSAKMFQLKEITLILIFILIK
uniref:Uncharacterized protein n=1 Tax=Myoviridae sp. ct8ME27 TaxID=2826622 RepID=A0A8S5N860_9CAUD|nr:MAG TPA: hypothetical protein [Myoviridae sp. ct8ME27]